MYDIDSRSDLVTLMELFYSKALADDVIGYFFTEVAPLNMETHLPLIVSFWESVVFDKTGYKGNVMQVHQHIHQLAAFRDQHFVRWVELFKQTVTELYSGENAEKIKQRAESIATVMRIKLVHSGIEKK